MIHAVVWTTFLFGSSACRPNCDGPDAFGLTGSPHALAGSSPDRQARPLPETVNLRQDD
jgi:hypothetical protein